MADDDPLVRLLLRKELRRQKRIELIGEAADGWEALKLSSELKPDILLLDLLMPRLLGIDTLRHLTSAAAPLRTIVLCSSIEKRQVLEALQLGARAILLKDSVNYLPMCIEAVMDGDYWITDRRLKNRWPHSWMKLVLKPKR